MTLLTKTKMVIPEEDLAREMAVLDRIQVEDVVVIKHRFTTW